MKQKISGTVQPLTYLPVLLARFLVLFVILNSQALAVCVGQQTPSTQPIRILVKTTTDANCFWKGVAPDGKVWGCVDIKYPLLGFSPTTVSPGSDNSGSHTTNPLTAQCVDDRDGDSYGDISYKISTSSLKDLGTYTFDTEGMAGAGGFATQPIASVQWQLVVYNDAPQLTKKPTPPSGTPKTGDTLHFAAECKDDDGGQASGVWSVDPPRDKNKLIPSGNGVDLALKNKADAGQWTVRVQCVDDEGELKDFGNDGKVTFDVDFANHPPVIHVDPPGPITIDVLKDILLQAGPERDQDDEKISWLWDIKAPSTASTKVSDLTQSTIQFTTKQEDIGDWSFTVVGTDESGAKSDPVTVNVLVNNLAPNLQLKKSKDQIKEGGSFSVEVDTTNSNDPDGGPLNFKYDIVQAPTSNPTHVQEGNWSTNSTYTVPDASAGVWIVRVTARDNEPPQYQKNSEPKYYVVLLDAQPEAKIDGPAEEIFQLQSGGELLLDGTKSEDPDSPCPDDPKRCHDREDDGPAQNMDISDPPISQYSWFLREAPQKYRDKYPEGYVHEIFGVPQQGELKLSFDKLGPGDWVFSLVVKDHENNWSPQEALKIVTIVDPLSPPVAVIDPPMPIRYLTTADGTCCFLWNDVGNNQVSVRLNGTMSFDPDKFPNGFPISPCTTNCGINEYKWENLIWPSGCSATNPSGTNSQNLELFSAGSVIPTPCMGVWATQLTVTDDDLPSPKTNSASALTILGNCGPALCIDFPTQATPAPVEFSKDTDILIFFHLDAGSANAFTNGSFAQLKVFRGEDVTALPVYTTPDPNLLPTNQGGFLVFHWNGQVNGATRPDPGEYSICISLLDSFLNPAVNIPDACELSAIQISVIETKILPTSTKYINYDNLTSTSTKVNINFEIIGKSQPDELHWRLLDDTHIVFEETYPRKYGR